MEKTSLSQAKHFIQDESGVYSVMGGLLALPVLALIFISLEGAGIIQDQARLSDSLEQAVLSLTAENNSGRKDTDYKLSGSNPNDDSFNINSEVGKRDHEIVTTFVKTFLPQTNESKINLTPICKTKSDTDSDGHISSSEVLCTVGGTIEHKSWFPFKVGNLEVIPRQVNVASQSKAIKRNSFNIPIDLMVVADLSGSMNYDVANSKKIYGKSSKLGILKEVLTELAETTLLSEEANPNNRIYVTPFALGAEISSHSCALPYSWDIDKDLRKLQASTNYSTAGEYSRANFMDALVYKLNTKATLENIGKQANYKITFHKSSSCLENMKTNNKGWYSHQNKSEFTNYVDSLKADGATLASSGLLVAADNMIKSGSRTKELNEQTQRVILVLSDGNDEILKGEIDGIPFANYARITENLIYGKQEEFRSRAKQIHFEDGTLNTYLQNKIPNRITSSGMCEVIREKLNNLNNDRNTRIVFVEFGYASRSKQAWKHCVKGDDNYYSANDKESLLNSFKQAIGYTDDIGRSIN